MSGGSFQAQCRELYLQVSFFFNIFPSLLLIVFCLFFPIWNQRPIWNPIYINAPAPEKILTYMPIYLNKLSMAWTE